MYRAGQASHALSQHMRDTSRSYEG